jgi:2-polyprenyl-6-methoxyphenol hydroxylase-like FAD-dependent oxidoreductase
MTREHPVLDRVVIGAGPAGLGTALALGAVKDLSLGVFERGAIGQTFADWPSGQRSSRRPSPATGSARRT